MALTKHGYPVVADGILGQKTKKALAKFAIDKGLPCGNIGCFSPTAFEALGLGSFRDSEMRLNR